jgi:hypothetical protein
MMTPSAIPARRRLRAAVRRRSWNNRSGTPAAFVAFAQVEQKGVFCALYSDRGSHFWLTPKAGEAVDPHRLTQVGRAMRELGVRM